MMSNPYFSFNVSGWFARDPAILKRIGNVLLPPLDANLTNSKSIIIAEDCFKLLNIPIDRVKQILVKSIEKSFGGKIIGAIALML